VYKRQRGLGDVYKRQQMDSGNKIFGMQNGMLLHSAVKPATHKIFLSATDCTLTNKLAGSKLVG
jgi:hypothetical protein